MAALLPGPGGQLQHDAYAALRQCGGGSQTAAGTGGAPFASGLLLPYRFDAALLLLWVFFWGILDFFRDG